MNDAELLELAQKEKVKLEKYGNFIECDEDWNLYCLLKDYLKIKHINVSNTQNQHWHDSNLI